MTEATASSPYRVLFLCTHNSSRSQMAEGLLRARGGTRYQVFSAVHPLAIRAMAELGIDISEGAGHRAKGIEAFNDAPPMDLVVTVCDEAAEECLYFPRPPPGALELPRPKQSLWERGGTAGDLPPGARCDCGAHRDIYPAGVG